MKTFDLILVMYVTKIYFAIVIIPNKLLYNYGQLIVGMIKTKIFKIITIKNKL